MSISRHNYNLSALQEIQAQLAADPQARLQQILDQINESLPPNSTNDPTLIPMILSFIQRRLLTMIKELQVSIRQMMELRGTGASNANYSDSGLDHLLALIETQSSLFAEVKAINLYFAQLELPIPTDN
jgi:hypothetical protein